MKPCVKFQNPIFLLYKFVNEKPNSICIKLYQHKRKKYSVNKPECTKLVEKFREPSMTINVHEFYAYLERTGKKTREE